MVVIIIKPETVTPNVGFRQPNAKGWKEKFNNNEFAAKKKVQKGDNLIQWAGGFRQRKDFDKRRDNLGEWTEVLFHH